MNKEETKEEPIIIPEVADVKEPEKFVDVPFDPRRKIDDLTLKNISGVTKIRVVATNNQEIATTTDTKIQFSSETYDEKNEFDSTTNYRFTADNDGFYHISSILLLDRAVDDKLFKLMIYKNGAKYSISFDSRTHGTSAQGSSISDILKLDAGDYVEIYFFQNTGSSVYTESTSGVNGSSCYLNIHQLS